jgi:hypothetical protein
VQVVVHDGYELREKDYRELRLLRERSGVELPPPVAARAVEAGRGARALAARRGRPCGRIVTVT